MTMWTLIGYGICIVGSAIGMFFVMRKFPQYFHIDDMLKAKKAEILATINAKKDITVKEIKKLIENI